MSSLFDSLAVVVPVLIVDLDDDEAELLLATADPIGEMGETCKTRLEELLSEIGSGSSGLCDYLAKLGQDNGIMPPAFEPVSSDEQGQLDKKKAIECPQCGHKFVK